MAPHTFTNETYVELLLLYFRNGENQSSVQEIKHGRPKSATAENNTIDILASVEIEPKLSVRPRAQASGISKNSVCRILKTNKIHLYKTRFVQELLARDPVNRLQFCRWVAQQIEQDPQFYKKIIFTDESTFVRHGQLHKNIPDLKESFIRFVMFHFMYKICTKVGEIITNLRIMHAVNVEFEAKIQDAAMELFTHQFPLDLHLHVENGPFPFDTVKRHLH
uniref:DUF4817 domain-containing protein n=1 Tax=Strigamia maritima TaxID=126957 RepID=T1IS56_STRMM